MVKYMPNHSERPATSGLVPLLTTDVELGESTEPLPGLEYSPYTGYMFPYVQ